MKSEPEIQKDIHHAQTKWIGKMHFESYVNDHIIHMDKKVIHGGDDLGPRPKPLFLSAIGGCTGMEIIAILEKMRLPIESLDIAVTAELTHEHPKMYKTIHIIFKIKTPSSEHLKFEKAIDLGVNKYCGAVAMMKQFATVTTENQFV